MPSGAARPAELREARPLAVDERPPIQTSGRPQRRRGLPSGRAMGGSSPDGRRHAASMLAAASGVPTGQGKAAHGRRRRWLAAMNRVVADSHWEDHHVLLDHWLRRPPQVPSTACRASPPGPTRWRGGSASRAVGRCGGDLPPRPLRDERPVRRGLHLTARRWSSGGRRWPTPRDRPAIRSALRCVEGRDEGPDKLRRGGHGLGCRWGYVPVASAVGTPVGSQT